jgi:polysaccharide biosynthesis/export protein
MKKTLIFILLFCQTALLAAQGAVKNASAKEKDPVSASAPAKGVPTGPDYRIGPQDVLNISVWKEPEISAAALPVRPDGKISIPLLNDVQAAGLTPMELQEAISEKLKKYVDEPQVTITVIAVNSQMVYLVGEIGRPGSMKLMPGMTALEAISSAGGPSQFARMKKIYIRRRTAEGERRIRFNYKAAMKNGASDLVLQPGDTVVVP